MYNVYAIGSLLLIATVIVVPTVILTVYPVVVNVGIIFGWEDNRCIQAINKCLLIHRLKPILDSFQGDYKHHLHFFAGVYFFLYRSLFFCIVVGGSTPDIDVLFIFIIVFFFLIAIVHVLTMPFKRYIDNAAYTSIYMLMLALWTMEYFLLPSNKSSSNKSSYTVTLLWFRIFLSSLPLCFCVLYWSSRLLNKFWSFHKVKNVHYEPLLAFPDRLIDDDDDDDDEDGDDDKDQ